ncbi:MAG: type II toxin-antitoxin system HicB family antitoxin [Holophagales bacterium]|nr:type II toxin-antitoxin system HicB family antitoxin [Holophagales bacterium]MYF94929.1 type II toxin-antitoxin system HicB family antitoxin [Holophagales bacterium]
MALPRNGLAIEAHQENGEWVATCPDLGLASQGASLNEALEMLNEAMLLFFQTSDELGILAEELAKKGLLTGGLAPR